jgi:hypothetical protein
VPSKINSKAKTNSKAVNESVYRQLMGSFIYFTDTRPDLSYAVSFISRFVTVPKVAHWIVAKRVLRYVKGTLGFGLSTAEAKTLGCVGYTNSDWEGCVHYPPRGDNFGGTLTRVLCC